MNYDNNWTHLITQLNAYAVAAALTRIISALQM